VVAFKAMDGRHVACFALACSGTPWPNQQRNLSMSSHIKKQEG